jgi:serine/threonine protein kinase
MLDGAPPFYSRNKAKMFRNRLERPIEIREHFSEDAQSLLQGLLCNDPRIRLGAHGHAEIKEHAFFHSVDWTAMAAL